MIRSPSIHANRQQCRWIGRPPGIFPFGMLPTLQFQGGDLRGPLVLRPPLHLLAVIIRPPIGIDVPGGAVKRMLNRFPAHPLGRPRRQMHPGVQTPSLLLRGKKSGHMAGTALSVVAIPHGHVYFVFRVFPPRPTTSCFRCRNAGTRPDPPGPPPGKVQPVPQGRPPSPPGQRRRPSLPIPKTSRPSPADSRPLGYIYPTLQKPRPSRAPAPFHEQTSVPCQPWQTPFLIRVPTRDAPQPIVPASCRKTRHAPYLVSHGRSCAIAQHGYCCFNRGSSSSIGP